MSEAATPSAWVSAAVDNGFALLYGSQKNNCKITS
jgi:hypothetical protein